MSSGVVAVRPAREHLAELASRLSVRCVYADLDGTLVGPGGSLFAGRDGPTAAPAQAVARVLAAGIDLVLMSGRNRDQTREAARTLGAAGYVAEMGALVVRRSGPVEHLTRNFGSFRGGGRPFDAIIRSGAAGALLDAFRGRLEPHAPWASVERECTVVLRGNLPMEEARSLLDRTGYGWLDLLDNGILRGGPDRFRSLEVHPVHVYHLLPRGVSKASAIAVDRNLQALDAAACIAIGDSPSDGAVSTEVAAVFIVANGEPAMAGLTLADNVYLLDRSHGEGFAEIARTFVAPGS